MNHCRLATIDDYGEIFALWQTVFNDELYFITESLKIFAGIGNIYICTASNGNLLAMLSAVPCTLQNFKGVYFYALASSPFARQKGVMTNLMQFAEEAVKNQGAHFSVLIPADEPLFTYYKKRAYIQTIYLKNTSVSLSDLSGTKACPVKYINCTGEKFANWRKTFAPAGHISFSTARYDVLLHDIYNSNGYITSTSNGYAVYFIKNSKLEIAELFASDALTAQSLLLSLLNETSCTSAQITLAQTSAYFAQTSFSKPFALAKPFTVQAQSIAYDNVYLRFGFE